MRWLRWLVYGPAFVLAMVGGVAFADTDTGLLYTAFNITQAPPYRDDEGYEVCASGSYANVNQVWGGAVAGCDAADLVMVHYSGFLTFPDGVTTAQFIIYSDDGGWVEIGDQQFGYWGDRGCSGTVSPLYQVSGAYPFDGWFYENGGGTCFILYWRLNMGSWQVVPSSAFTHTAPPTTTTTTTTTTVAETTTSLAETTTVPETTTSVAAATTVAVTTTDAEPETTTSQPSDPSTTTTTTTTQPAQSAPAPSPEPQPSPSSQQPSPTVPAPTSTESPQTTTEPTPPSSPPTTASSVPPPSSPSSQSSFPVSAPKPPRTTVASGTVKPPTTTVVDGPPTGTTTPTKPEADATPIPASTVAPVVVAGAPSLDSVNPPSTATQPEVQQQFEIAAAVTEVIDDPNQLTVEQFTEILDDLDFDAMSDDQTEAVAEALSQAKPEVKKKFEEVVDIFGAGLDNYVPIGSKIPVGERRLIVAATSLVFVLPTPAPTASSRRST